MTHKAPPTGQGLHGQDDLQRNLTNRQFTVDGQNPLRVANMTNRPTSCRFIYLAMAGDARAVSAA